MSDASSKYEVHVADGERQRAIVTSLWRNHPGDPTDLEAKYDWFYRDNPSGPSTVLLLSHGSEYVGVTGLGARQISARGRAHSAGVMADLVVHPQHRSLYPALLLLKEMNRVGLGAHALLYGLPNAKSAPLLQRLGYTQVGDFARYAGVLRHGNYLRRWLPRSLANAGGTALDRAVPWISRPHRALLGNWQWEWLDAFDARFDSLWERARNFEGIIGARDSRYLSWRFLLRPGRRRRVFAISNGSDGELAGYAVCEFGESVLQIADVLVDPAQKDALHVMLYLLAGQAFDLGHASLSLDIVAGEHTHRTLMSAGLRLRERRPFYASYGDDLQSFKTAEWYATRADLDV